jgi:Protein of unknown function (DUF2798)
MKPKTAQLSAMGIMVLIMTMVVVFVSTWTNFGLDDTFLLRLFRGWGIAFVIAYPLVIVPIPRLKKAFQGLVKKA